jgi:tRNA(Arg) A34 adenosine deaminase TadA
VSSCQAHELPSLNHRIEVVGGVLDEECRAIIQEFFKTRRTPTLQSGRTDKV